MATNIVRSAFPDFAGILATPQESLFAAPIQAARARAETPMQAITGEIQGAGAQLQQSVGGLFGQVPAAVAQQNKVAAIVQQVQSEGVDVSTPEGQIRLAQEFSKYPEFIGMATALRQQAATAAQESALKQAQTAKALAEAKKASTEQGPFGKVNPADFTPESLSKFSTTGNYADLVPLPGKAGAGTEFERLIADLPPEQQANARQQRLRNLLSGGGMSPSLVPIALKEADAASSIAFGAAEVNNTLNDLKSGTLKLGLKENFANSLKTLAGKSDEGSRAFSRFNTALETLRNARLNLNVGVQTEGDAVRAANEFLANFDKYDTQTALAQLQRVSDKMSAAQKSKEARLRALYKQSGVDLPAEFFSSFGGAQAPTAPVAISDEIIRREFNDPKNAGWQQLGFEAFKKAFLQQNSGK